MGQIVNQRSEDGVVQEFLDGTVLKEGERIGILWPDQYKEDYPVMIISQIVPNGMREVAHVRISLHAVSVPVSITHLISLGVEVSRKSLW